MNKLKFLFFVILINFQIVFSSGKITGKVVDASTGDALFNVNILVVGTSRGAVSDFDGKFTIDNIAAGKHTLRASLIGYENKEGKVEVKDAQTVNINFKLTSTSVQIKGVEVMGESKIVNVQATSSTKTMSSKAIEQIPNVKSVQDVMQLQAGAVKMGNNVFLRGGRANEVQYIVDGISVNDVLGGSAGTTSEANSQLQQFNSGVGNSISTSGLNISTNAIQTLSVTTSGMDAEYGNAQSGVITIITKSGSDNFTGSLQIRDDGMNNATSFNEKYYSISFGGPIAKFESQKLTFFISSDFNQSDAPYNFINNSFYNPLRRTVQIQGSLGNFLKLSYYDKLSNEFTFNGKLRYDVNGSDQFSYSYRTNSGTYHDYRHIWKLLADSSRQNENVSEQNTFQWMHFIGNDGYLRMQGSILQIGRNESVSGLKPYEYSPITDATQYDPSRDGFYDLGSSQVWKDSRTTVSTIKFDLNNPIAKNIFFKTGFEYNFEKILSTEISYPLGKISYNGQTYSAPYPDSVRYDEGEFPGYGVYRWYLSNMPQTGSMYVQNNMKIFGTNLHIGLRYDFLYVGEEVFERKFIDAWKDATGFDSTKWDWNKNSLMDAILSGKISPRLAINFPITDRVGFFFNYGHFMQFPERMLYIRPAYVVDEDITVGNPNLKPQRTVQYESGFESQITDDLALGIRGFYKDIFDYVITLPAEKVLIYMNNDFASSRGFEITLNKGLVKYFSGNVSYSYQIAKGRSSNPFESAISSNFQLPRESRLDWDQRHTLNLFLNFRVDENDDFSIFEIPFFNDWGSSLTWSFGSGFPYTPTSSRVSTIEDAYKKNTADGPSTHTMNFAFYKKFRLLNKMNIDITFDILNILNTKNVTSLGDGFNVNEGRQFQFGDYDINTNQMYQWYQMPSKLPPYIYGNPRQILLGMKLNWG